MPGHVGQEQEHSALGSPFRTGAGNAFGSMTHEPGTGGASPRRQAGRGTRSQAGTHTWSRFQVLKRTRLSRFP